MTEAQETIERLRSKGWTMVGIARGMGVSEMTVHRWWRGTAVPANTLVVNLALKQLLNQPAPKRRYRRRQAK
jgi:transcriptional regulator with XRE-family HTH domain